MYLLTLISDTIIRTCIATTKTKKEISRTIHNGTLPIEGTFVLDNAPKLCKKSQVQDDLFFEALGKK